MGAGSGEPSRRTATSGASLSEITAASAQSMPERKRRISPRTKVVLGTAAGLLAGLLVGRDARKRGNEITGDVAVHLLNKIELLTIRLQVRQARRGGPTEIDVHHVRADTTSRP
jgi:hypothetical protein